MSQFAQTAQIPPNLVPSGSGPRADSVYAGNAAVYVGNAPIYAGNDTVFAAVYAGNTAIYVVDADICGRALAGSERTDVPQKLPGRLSRVSSRHGSVECRVEREQVGLPCMCVFWQRLHLMLPEMTLTVCATSFCCKQSLHVLAADAGVKADKYFRLTLEPWMLAGSGSRMRCSVPALSRKR